MKEINKHILEQAIRELPEYNPPPGIWEGIESGLLAADQNDQIAEVVNELPEYEPPAQIWDAIEEELQSEVITKPGKVVKLGLRRILSYAAIASGLIFGIFWLNGNQPSSSIAYSEEVIEDDFYANDWDMDEEEFEMVLAELEETEYFQQIPEIQQLKFELAELNDAKLEVEEMIDAYGSDETVIEQIREIELERTDIIKRLAAFISTV